MSRNLIVGLSVAIVAALAFIVIRGIMPTTMPPVETAGAVAPVPVEAPVVVPVEPEPVAPDAAASDPSPQATVADEVAAGTDAVEDVAGKAADAAGAAIAEGAAALSGVTEDAVATMEDAAPKAADATKEAVTDGAAALSGAAAGAVAAITDAAPEASQPTAGSTGPVATVIYDRAPAADVEVPTPDEVGALLTPEGFDAQRLVAYVEQADLAEDVRADLRGAIERAQADDAKVPAVIEELREGLGIE